MRPSAFVFWLILGTFGGVVLLALVAYLGR